MGSAIDSLKSRNSELDSEVRDLMETKYKLDSRLSDVVSRLHAAESELQTSKIELARLKKTYTDLDKVGFDF
jgi:predicted  nucleic acid-binding Zn-ribbon protein